MEYSDTPAIKKIKEITLTKGIKVVYIPRESVYNIYCEKCFASAQLSLESLEEIQEVKANHVCEPDEVIVCKPKGNEA